MDEFVRYMREQQELVRRAVEGPAKYFREHQAAMQDLVRRMDAAAASDSGRIRTHLCCA